MSLQPGARLGPYEILAPLGAGGMGEVYRARDPRLQREVAIKILPQSVAADPERLARFEREAKVLASLNHPAIAAIYGMEESGPATALVIELVEGPTLADRLASGPLALDEALRVARQIADALEAAHDKGVVHRDLKPANVKVTVDGDVKVLDFGLAKALDAPSSSDLAHSPTITAMATQHGVILGTAAYMSPEQARGGVVDKRADIWAWGCVLFEMLSGKRAFEAETVTDTLAAVLRADVEWSALPPETPPALRRLLARCLEKDRKQRLHDIGDARFELEEALRAPTAAPEAPASPALEGLRRQARNGWIAAAAALAVALVAIALAARRGAAPETRPPEVTRFTIVDPPLARFVGYPRLALSPDGDRLFFAAERDGVRQLYVRSLDRLEATPVPGTEGLDGVVTVAPDGDRVAFVRGQELLTLSLRGGAPVAMMRALNFRGAAWGDDDVIWYTRSTEHGLYRVAADGRELGLTVSPDPEKEERSLRWPWALPGGQGVLYQVATASISSFDDAPIEAFSLATKQRSRLVERGNHPAFFPPSTLLFVRDGTLMAVPFDAGRLTVTGTPTAVEAGVMMDPSNGAVDLAVAADGTLAYTAGQSLRFARRLVWFDRQGRSGPLTSEVGGFQGIDASPDGGALLVDIDAANANVWKLDLDRGTLVRLTIKWSNNQAIWTPDGEQMIYTSARGGEYHLWRERIDGVGDAEKLTSSPWPMFPEDVSPDGRTLLYRIAENLQDDLWTLALDGHGTPSAWSDTRYVEDGGAFSPDGRWIAYQSAESGRLEIYVAPFPGPGAKTRVSEAGGIQPAWSPDGRELFFLEGSLEASRMKAARVDIKGGRIAVSAPVTLFELPTLGSYVASTAGKSFDVLPDGRFALILTPAAADEPERIVVVRNWSPSAATTR